MRINNNVNSRGACRTRLRTQGCLPNRLALHTWIADGFALLGLTLVQLHLPLVFTADIMIANSFPRYPSKDGLGRGYPQSINKIVTFAGAECPIQFLRTHLIDFS